jgi:hypothetical protein
VVAAARTLSALAAVPGFFAGGPAIAVAAVLVIATALALVLFIRGYSRIPAEAPGR